MLYKREIYNNKFHVTISRFNLTDKEGVADRKVPEQPLAFYSKEGTISRYNLRKVREEKYIHTTIYIYIYMIILELCIPFFLIEVW